MQCLFGIIDAFAMLHPMGAAKITPDEWAEIRRANEQGVSTEALAATWKHRGITTNAIRQRRHREGWLTPRKVQEEAMVQETRRKARVMPSSGLTPVTVDLSALSVTAANLNDKAHAGTLIAASLFLDAIGAAARQGILPPQNVRELYTSMKGLRHAAGMDKEGLAINIGAYFNTGRAQTPTGGACRDVTPRPIIIAAKP